MFEVVLKDLEADIRLLNDRPSILETYVICGPIFHFDKPVEVIGTDDDNDVSIPVPNAFFNPNYAMELGKPS